jgi:hypothetical protein
MSNFICSVDSCPVILSSICVIYQGENLIYTGISDGDNLQAALQKIDAAFADAGLGYAFQNGIVQTTPGVPVELGGSLLRDTTIAGNYKLTLAGRIEAARHITTGGTASQFVKGDGTLDSNAYQLAGNYITALTGDGTAVGPGSAALTLATVNANPGTYGTGTLIPRITVDAKGRVTSITTTAIPNISNILVFEGDVTGSGTTGAPVTLTLATVNPNVYNSLTFLNLKVNAKGLVTGASPVTNLDIEGALGYVPVPNTRTITINGVTQNLQANRSWTIASGVASVTATAPLVATTGANPNISIPKADATTDGYLDNTDWVTFNNKVPTTRTLTINGVSFDLAADRTWTINSMVYPSAGIAISTGTAWGTSITDNSTNWNTAYTERISSATAPLSIASNVISISQASGSTNGYLSSTDWNTFNNKQPAGNYVTTSRTISTTSPLQGGGDLSADRTLSILQASASQDGYLSSIDWTTFNNKEGSITPGTTLQYWRGDKSWHALDTTAVVEGTNLYYTDARVRLALSVSAPLTYDNTTGQFGIQVANTSQSGYLTSTDWNTFNNKQASGHYITDLTGEATATGPGIATVTLSNPAVTGKVLTGVNITGGTVVATDTILQAFGKVQNQINSLIGGSIYQGVWNAATNTPTLTSGVGTDGYYYITNVAGNTNLDGISDWHVGDWAIFHGGVWQQVDNTDAVVSVNGYTGAVSLVSSDIPEGATNLYFTNTRARQAISLTTTGSSGAATYNDGTGVLNIPNYNPDLSGYVPATRTLTINGTAFDLTADRSWSVGTVTSVAELTLGTTGTDVTSSVATGTTTPVITLNIPTASAANRGALSSADWTTFNSKQAALNGTGFVKISGTTITYDNSTYALDSAVVKLTGDQSISGTKTFTGFGLFDNTIFIKQDSSVSFLAGYNSIDSDTTGIIFSLPAGNMAKFVLTSLSASRNYTLPNATGTIALTSDIVPYSLPIATASVLGGIKVGSNLSINATTGVLDATYSYTLPIASTTVLGGVKVDGSTITINATTGVISGTASYSLPIATASVLGGVKIGAGVSVDAGGIISVSTNYVASRGQTNWNDSTVIGNVVGMLAWKNYGNNHVIFDASQSFSPSGSSVNSTNSAVAWTATYPTLMGWNGSTTYGVRVDTARYADSAGSVAWINISSKPALVMYYQGFTLDANTMDGNSTGFTYSNNAPYTGPIARLSETGYSLQLNAAYSGGGTGIAFRTRNGDSGTFNPWRVILNDANYTSYSPSLTGSGASGTWGINITGSSRSVLFSGDSAKQITDGLWAGGGSYPGYQFTGGNSRFGFSSTSGVLDVYADGNFYATDSSHLVWHAGNMDAPNKSGTSYYQTNTWIQFNGNYGIYFPNNYGLHFYPNNDGSYGAAQILGEKNSWKGLHFGGGTGMTLMMNETEFGFHRQGNGWYARFTNGMGYFSISGNASNVTSISSATGNNYNWTGLNYFVSNRNTSTDSAPLQAYSNNGSGAIMSFHRGGYYAVNFGLDSDNVMRIGGWSAGVNRWQLDMSGNQTVAGNVTASSDVYSNNGWFYSYNNAGWYNNTYGQGIRPAKANVTYGSIINLGENYNGYGGYAITNNYNTIFMQNSGGDHGFFRDGGGGGWSFFYHQNYNCAGIGTDATDPSYSLHIIKYGGSNTGWIIWSDRRIKENIKTIDNALDKVLSLRGVYYNKIDDPNKERCVGYIAQEVMEVVPELVVYSEELDMYNMNYAPMVGMLTEAIKEQQAQIEELKQQVQLLLNR